MAPNYIKLIWSVFVVKIHDVGFVVAAPLEGPAISLNVRPRRNEATLEWTEIPQRNRRGFITNYTIFYTQGTQTYGMTLPMQISLLATIGYIYILNVY